MCSPIAWIRIPDNLTPVVDRTGPTKVSAEGAEVAHDSVLVHECTIGRTTPTWQRLAILSNNLTRIIDGVGERTAIAEAAKVNDPAMRPEGWMKYLVSWQGGGAYDFLLA